MKKKRPGEDSEIPAPAASKGARANVHAPTPRHPETPVPDTGFPVVGIGASAAGTAAVDAFFSALPADGDGSGMALVLVPHPAPGGGSGLFNRIRRATRLRVFAVENGMAVRPNGVYIAPPNRDMALFNGTLRLRKPSAPRGPRLPIDFFFRSLARDRRERAIGIVLSGAGGDGALGVRAIKGEGGMAMAQNPESAECGGMPRNAIATGLVDFVLPPAEMPAHLAAYAARAFGKAARPVSIPAAKDEESLKKIFSLLRARTDHDFSHYKRNTVQRRVERRMAVRQIGRLDGYVRCLQKNPAEVKALFRDLLIGVTGFFRDPEAFAALQKRVIPRLFAGKPAGATIRVWVPGCSTGEEAYSIAILLQERLEALQQRYKAQVFATDIDSRAVEQARDGVYPASIAADVSPERLARFFAQEPDSGVYRVRKSLRDMLVFSRQDATEDPPFSRLDLISCRNLLIYLDGKLQRKLIPLFHYALNPGGRLFLGTSETVDEFANLFSPLDRKAKLYRRNKDLPDARRAAMSRFLPPDTAWGGGKSRPRGIAGRTLSSRDAPRGARGRQDLNAFNEEMRSLNQELQSANEELETAKEEMRSVNEELSTVNTELQLKVADLSRANNDMNNLLAGTDIGAVFVDHQLRLQRFTPAVTRAIGLNLSDVGRPIGHIVSHLADYDRLAADVRAVLDTLASKEIEARTRTGAWFLLRIRPYRTQDNVIEGAVIVVSDITGTKKTQAALREAEALRRLAAVARDTRDAVLVRDPRGRILAWNPGATRLYGWTETEALAMNIRDLLPEGRRETAPAALWQLGRAGILKPIRAQRLARDGRSVDVLLIATALADQAGDVYAIATVERGVGGGLKDLTMSQRQLDKAPGAV